MGQIEEKVLAAYTSEKDTLRCRLFDDNGNTIGFVDTSRK